MGWFNQKKEKEQEQKSPKLPKLPELPKLSEPPKTKEKEPLHQLPSFPNSSFGSKFSQNAIKDAVNGKKEEGGFSSANDFNEDERMMPEPISEPTTEELPSLKRIKSRLSREIDEEVPEEFEEASKIVKKAEPVFIRLDRFEESMKIFENARNKIVDIENMLKDVERIKQEEEQELQTWRSEIQSIKKQIEKIDKDIFSKIE